jgi:hypothetical protein
VSINGLLVAVVAQLPHGVVVLVLGPQVELVVVVLLVLLPQVR